MWKSAYVGVYQLLNWKMHGETLKIVFTVVLFTSRHSDTCDSVFTAKVTRGL